MYVQCIRLYVAQYNHSLWEENFSSGELTVTPEKMKYLLDQAQAESAACICGSLGQPLSLIRISINCKIMFARAREINFYKSQQKLLHLKFTVRFDLISKQHTHHGVFQLL